MDGPTWRQRAASFGAAAEVYQRSRPGYPRPAVRHLLPAHCRRVLDLGAGTGKLTQALLELGPDVVAVEPSEALRALLPVEVDALDGTAESVPLTGGSVDAVLVGQAFHWFDPALALPEIVRVLRPGGTLGLLWNVHDESVDWVRSVWEVFDNERIEVVDQAPFASVAGLSEPQKAEFLHRQVLNADLLVDLVASRSAVLTMPEPERTRVLQQVRLRAPKHEPFELPYRCAVWRSVRT